MLVSALLEAEARVPKKVAVADTFRTLTYRQLALLARVMRGVVLRGTSLDRVGIMLPASTVCPATLFGVLWASKKAVPLNFLLAGDELAQIVKDAGLDLIITVRHFSELAEELPARAIFLEDLPLKRKVIFEMLKRRPRVPEVLPDSTAVLLYTSGTTAEPKGVELTHENLHTNCLNSIASLNLTAEQVILNVLPPFHVFGLTGTVFLPVYLGATVRAIPRFSPMALIKTVEEHAVTSLIAIPSMYAAVLKTKSAAAESFRSVTIAISGGEPLPERVRLGFAERFGVDLLEGYGLTETSPVVAANAPHAAKVGTVGRPVRNVEVRIVSEEGAEVPAGEAGEIHVRGAGVMKGYYRKPDATRAVIDADGWFHTGDIGVLDDDGFLAITGRVKDMLIIGGENVFPREIEAVLEDHAGVLQAAVIGVPDDLRGEVAVAFVIPEQGAEVTEAGLRNHAKQSLAGFKVPRRVEISDDLPTGPTGKLLKRRLRELL